MEKKTREEQRQFIYNTMLFELQLLGVHNSYDSFLHEFKSRMIEKIGECTEDDEKWVEDGLGRFVKHMEKQSKE